MAKSNRTAHVYLPPTYSACFGDYFIAGISYVEDTYHINRHNSDWTIIEYVLQGTGTLLAPDGKEYILDNFKLSSFDDEFCGHIYEASHQLTLNDFFEIIRCTRNMIVHQGIYWEMQFFAHDDDSTWLASIETTEKILKSYTYQSKNSRSITYHFETTMKYEQFIFFFVEACVKYIKSGDSASGPGQNNT